MQRLLTAVIRAYQVLLSPVLGANCRFHPSCSEYARVAIERHGALRGTWIAIRRVGRCHPFHQGGLDPVEENSHEAQDHQHHCAGEQGSPPQAVQRREEIGAAADGDDGHDQRFLQKGIQQEHRRVGRLLVGVLQGIQDGGPGEALQGEIDRLGSRFQ